MSAQLYDTHTGKTYLLDPGKRFVKGRYRGAPLGGETRASLRRACEGAGGPAAREALAVIESLDRLDRADLTGAFEVLLAELDLGRAPSRLYTRVAHYLIALSAERAGPVLHRRASEALAAGADAVPYAALLAASGDDRSMFDLRNQAGRLRDLGHPGARPVIQALAVTPPSPWLHTLREHLYPPSTEESSEEARSTLAARVARALRLGAAPEDAALVAEVVQALRATPMDDVEKRAALRRMLEDLTSEARAQGA